MALFGKKKTEETASAAPAPVAASASVTRDLSAVLLRPLITEKAAVLGDQNIYTFEIHANATKYDVRDAVAALFKVTPVKVRIVRRKPQVRRSATRGPRGVIPGMKKAYVYLKEGDRIELV